MSNEQVIFNTLLRSARDQVECALGRLKARSVGISYQNI
jgi:hypothetical protein